MHADRTMAGAWPASDHGSGRAAGEFTISLCCIHRPGLEPAGHQLELLMHRVETVQHIQIALSGNGEDVVYALGDQSIRQDTPTRPRPLPCRVRPLQFHSGHSLAGAG